MGKKKIGFTPPETTAAVAETNGHATLEEGPIAVIDAPLAVDVPASGDAVDSENAAETAKLRKELEDARREVAALQNRLSAVSHADQYIIDAEQKATECAEQLAEADAVRKDKKKKLDAAMENLRAAVRDRMVGQTSLFDWQAKKAEHAPAKPQVVETAVGLVPQPAADLSPMDEQITAVSEISEGVQKSLAAAGLMTVREVWNLIQENKLDIKGIGKSKVSKLADILKRFLKVEEPKPEAIANEATAPVLGEAKERVCGLCGERWELPSEQVICGKCGEMELIYEVGFYGEANCDCEGEFPLAEQVLVRVPATFGLPGIERYGFNILLAPTSDGLFRSGWEILHSDTLEHEGDVIHSDYPSIHRPGTDRATGLRLAFGALKKCFQTIVSDETEIDAWESAMKDRLNVEPLELGTNENAEPIAEVAAGS